MKKEKEKEKENIIENNIKKKLMPKEITEELKESYLDYAMSVIVSRALPDVRDGLKPVQRRILYAMKEAGFTHNAKFRKSASIVGEVLGKYHPHGDMPVYDALARMAQDFSLRYLLIDGQGNWGSIDGDEPAAMRYTEARLSRLAETLLLEDLEKETVEFQPNYDGTRKEPKVLPAKLPHLLINGASGIAVGMATSIPPHNLSEVIDATCYLIDHPEATTADLLKFIKGPDFPTGGIIFNQETLKEAYSTGRGSITVRAVAEIREKKSSQFEIVISEIPYQVNKAELLTQIADLIQNKKIEGIKDVRDESDKEGLRITIQLKNDAHPQKILNNLYKHTALQKDFYLNMLALVDGLQPQVLSLKSVLEQFLLYRRNVIEKRTRFDLKKAQDRLHILLGLSKALKNIDQVIKTIKASKDRLEAHQKLVKNFQLTSLQADAILEMKLQTLSNLEREKIEQEKKEKEKEIGYYQEILKNPKKVSQLIKEELESIKKEFGDERKTKVVIGEIKEFREEDLIPEEENIILLSRDSFIKRFSPEIFRSQKRGGRGILGFEIKEEDRLDLILKANTHDNLLFFTNKGRVFQIRAYEIPQASRTSRGKSLFNFLELPANEKIASLLALPSHNPPAYLILLTKNGIIKKVSLKEFQNVRRVGLLAIKLKKEDELLGAKFLEKNEEILITTANGQILRFPEKDLREMKRSASGVLGIKLRKGDEVKSFDLIKASLAKNGKLFLITEKGYGKYCPLSQYRQQHRAGYGIKTVKITNKTGKLIGIQVVPPEIKEILVSSKRGLLIKINSQDIPQQSRLTQGVRLIKLDPDDQVIGAVWF